MKSIRSLLLTLTLSLAVLAGCNVTVNEAPDNDAMMEDTSHNDTMMEDEDADDSAMMEDEDVDTEEESDTEDSDNTETEEDEGGLTLEISDDIKMVEVEKADLPVVDPETVEMKVNPDEVMIKVEQ